MPKQKKLTIKVVPKYKQKETHDAIFYAIRTCILEKLKDREISLEEKEKITRSVLEDFKGVLEPIIEGGLNVRDA